MKTTNALLIASALLTLSATAMAQDASRPYRDGPVVEVTTVRTKAGRFDDYMKYLSGTYKKSMDAQVKAGLVTTYRIFAVSPRTPQDPNVILTVTYPNMATLDKSAEFDSVAMSVAGPLDAQDKAYGDRGSMREVLGSTLMREMILK
jgi:hypothetical protein